MNDYERFDVITGTVTEETRKGVIVQSRDLPANSVCYCPGCLTKGDTALFTIQKYTITDAELKILLSFDSMIESAA